MMGQTPSSAFARSGLDRTQLEHPELAHAAGGVRPIMVDPEFIAQRLQNRPRERIAFDDVSSGSRWRGKHQPDPVLGYVDTQADLRIGTVVESAEQLRSRFVHG